MSAAMKILHRTNLALFDADILGKFLIISSFKVRIRNLENGFSFNGPSVRPTNISNFGLTI